MTSKLQGLLKLVQDARDYNSVTRIYDQINPQYQTEYGKLNGRWLVLSIKHHIFKDRHHEMTLTLSAFGRGIPGDVFEDVTYSETDSLERIQR